MICSKTLSHFLISTCPKPKCQTRPHQLCLSGATEFHLIQPLPNPNQFGLTDGISVSPRWACKLSIAHCNNFGLTEIMQSVPPSLLDQLSVSSLQKSVPPSSCNRSHRDEVFSLTLAHRSHRVDPVGPTEISNSH